MHMLLLLLLVSQVLQLPVLHAAGEGNKACAGC
jgi:hypothetical protein